MTSSGEQDDGPAEARGPAVWATDAWRDAATAWIDEALAAAGQPARSGPVEQPRIRPWGTVLRVPTAGGPVWMKAGGPGTSAEAGLYAVLARAAPQAVLTPLALDPARGWMLLPDGGPPLSEGRGGAAEQLAVFEQALGAYAELQLAVAPHVPALLAAGVTDMRPQRLPERLEEALDATAAYAALPGREPDLADHRRVAALRGELAAGAARLAASPVGASIDHNDLHSGNVLPGEEGRVRFYDWGDAVVAHPFASLLVPLTVVRDGVLGCTDDDPRLTRLRDAYLEPFRAFGTPGELVATAELASRLAKVARVLTWQRAIDSPGGEGSDFEGAPLATLRSLLDPSPYGGA